MFIYLCMKGKTLDRLIYSLRSAEPSTPFLNLSSAVRQLRTFQIPSTYEALLLKY